MPFNLTLVNRNFRFTKKDFSNYLIKEKVKEKKQRIPNIPRVRLHMETLFDIQNIGLRGTHVMEDFEEIDTLINTTNPIKDLRKTIVCDRP